MGTKNTSANTSTAYILKAPKALIYKAFGENQRGPERIWTAVQGCADLCLTTRPQDLLSAIIFLFQINRLQIN